MKPTAVLLAVLALATAAPAPADDLPPLTVGDHTFHRRVLDNGLRVAAVSDEGDLATVFVVVGAGKRQETEETNGLAHLTEHALYAGTPTLGADEHEARIVGWGGESNAFTRDDYTLFYDHEFPVDSLDLVLAMEADRLRNLTFEEEAFLHERGRLEKEERETWQPSDELDQRLEAVVYRVHNYRAGELDEDHHTRGPYLETDQARAFYDAYYHPNNVAVVVVGNVDPERALDAVERAFGAVPRGPEPPPVTPEPEVSGPRTETLPSSLTRERVEHVWIVPALDHPDRPALAVLARLLGRRTTWDGSPFFVNHRDRVDRELFRVAATGPDAAEELDALLEGIRARPVDASELDEVKRLLRDDFTGLPLRARPYFSLAGTFGVYEVLGLADVLAGYESAIDAVTPDELVRIANEHLDPGKRVTVRFEAGAAEAEPLPDDRKALSDAAQEAEAAGDLDRAIAAYTKLLEDEELSDMYTVIYLATRGQIRMQQQDYDGAIEDLEAALDVVDYPAVRDLLEEARALKAGGEPE